MTTKKAQTGPTARILSNHYNFLAVRVVSGAFTFVAILPLSFPREHEISKIEVYRTLRTGREVFLGYADTEQVERLAHPLSIAALRALRAEAEAA